MKKVLVVLTVFLLMSFSSAYAVQIMLPGASHGLGYNWVTINDTIQYIPAGEFIVTLDGLETYGYCVEINQPITFGGTYEYTLSGLDYTTGALQAAWLVNEYSTSIEDYIQSAGLQLAVWKSVYGDSFNVESMSASYVDYQTYYSSLQNVSFTNEIITDLESKFDIAFNSEYQDLLIYNPTKPVPEPATIALLGFGIASFAGFRRKFRK